MKRFLVFFSVLSLVGYPAFAHVGHFGDLAGHDHWVAGIAIGIAAGVAAWGAFKGGKKESDAKEASEHPEETAEPQEA